MKFRSSKALQRLLGEEWALLVFGEMTFLVTADEPGVECFGFGFEIAIT